jgi:poly-gamma-glutamate capsule biosynthesis protein CapA/YwtB (metallophosphatase superfamily)
MVAQAKPAPATPPVQTQPAIPPKPSARRANNSHIDPGFDPRSAQPTPTPAPSLSPTPQPAPTASPTPTPAPSPSPAPTPSPSLPPGTGITIKAVGDIIPGTNFPKVRLPSQPQVLFAQVQEALQGADVLFGNFESTLTTHPFTPKNVTTGRAFAFRTPPAYAKVLRQAGFNILSVANNHSFDFDSQGFRDTIRHIEAAEMAAVGRKGQIYYRTINGINTAWIAFSTYYEHNSVLDLPTMQALVRQARQKAPIVIISFHAGTEGIDATRTRDQTETFFSENRGNVVRFSRRAIEAGADLVLGHGPHVPRAIELYQGRLIAYSLGNFVGYQSLATVGALGDSLVLQVQLDPNGKFIRGQIIPIRLNGQGIPAPDPKGNSIQLIRQLTRLDFPKTPLQISPTGEITPILQPAPSTPKPAPKPTGSPQPTRSPQPTGIPNPTTSPAPNSPAISPQPTAPKEQQKIK